MNLPATLTRKIEVDLATGCWNFTGVPTRYGYARVYSSPHRMRHLHCLVYEQYNGPIPEGMRLHHTCGNRLCCSPAHLETVSPGDHQRLHHPRPTHCKRGHEFTEENTYTKPDGRRECRVCRVLRRPK